MTKNKYFLLLASSIIFIFLCAGIAHAALEVKYPSIPLPGITAPSADCTSDCLPKYVAYLFGVLVYIAGSLSVISFAIGAVGLISPNIEAHKDAKDRMKGAVLGLVLTVASFIIINTINPALTTLTLTSLPPTGVLFWINDKYRTPVLGLEVPDVANRGQALIDGNYNGIEYDCGGHAGAGTRPALLVWTFPRSNFQANDNNYSGVAVWRIKCGQNFIVSGLGSIKMGFETPGVYYCLGGCDDSKDYMCQGYMSPAHTDSQSNIEAPFARNIQAVRIVNDQANDLYYGVIFHEQIGLDSGGKCVSPIGLASGDVHCFQISALDRKRNLKYTVAADIFKYNKSFGESGDGVTFYSEPFGVNTGAYAGFYNVPDAAISTDGKPLDPSRMDFIYENVDQPEEYIDRWKTFQDHPGSIKIKGSYLVGLYSADSYCQTFTKDVPNLNAQPFLAAGTSLQDFDEIYIIPTK